MHTLSNTSDSMKQILLYLSDYTSRPFVVADVENKEVLYMSPAAMQLYGFEQESEWKGKTYLEVDFESKEKIHPTCYEPVGEDAFTSIEYYNDFHKRHVCVERKIVTIPNLEQKVLIALINDLTVQKQLEYKVELQKSVHECIDVLFTVGATSQDPHVAYTAILNQLKEYYDAEGTYFYQCMTDTYSVERVHTVFSEQLEGLEGILPMVVDEEELFYKQQQGYGIHAFTYTSIKNVAGDTVAFIGVINPKLHQDNKELLQLLSRPICMFIEFQQEQRMKQELLKLEANSKANVVKECVENFREFTHHKEHIRAVLNALCSHYDADFAVTLTRNKDEHSDYGISHIGGSNIPNLDELQRQPADSIKKWEQIFQEHKHYITDVDLDSPSAKALLKEKFGIYNFISAPIQDECGGLTGLLYVMNYKTYNRSNLLTHIVANNISAYLDKIYLYEAKHVEPLTKLTDKVATQNQIEEYLEDGTKGALFIIDIDHFKELNDRLGHLFGDKAIITLANIIKKNFRNTDVIGRIGGDEFMVFCPNLIVDDIIHQIAQRLLEVCKLSFQKDGVTVEITASIGICRVDHSCNTFQSLYEKADKVLYIAKHGGKNRYHIYGTPYEN